MCCALVLLQQKRKSTTTTTEIFLIYFLRDDFNELTHNKLLPIVLTTTEILSVYSKCVEINIFDQNSLVSIYASRHVRTWKWTEFVFHLLSFDAQTVEVKFGLVFGASKLLHSISRSELIEWWVGCHPREETNGMEFMKLISWFNECVGLINYTNHTNCVSEKSATTAPGGWCMIKRVKVSMTEAIKDS